MTNKYTQASKDLIIFLDRYMKLIDKHIIDIKNNINDTTGNLMSTLNEMDLAGEDRKKLANTVLTVKSKNKTDILKEKFQGDDDFFENTDISEIEKLEENIISNIKNDNDEGFKKIKFNKERFSKHMKNLDYLDEKIKNVMFTIMGALSNDDVISQRLIHILDAFKALQDGISKIIIKFDSNFNQKNINNFTSKSLDRMYSQYTMESEKKCFNSVIKNYNKSA